MSSTTCVILMLPIEHLTPETSVQGILRGLDQMTNLILAECQERVFSSKVLTRFHLLLFPP